MCVHNFEHRPYGVKTFWPVLTFSKSCLRVRIRGRLGSAPGAQAHRDDLVPCTLHGAGVRVMLVGVMVEVRVR